MLRKLTFIAVFVAIFAVKPWGNPNRRGQWLQRRYQNAIELC